MKNIPIVVGITGHRLLRKEDYPVLQEKVKNELLKIKESCPNSSLVLLDSIASGADTICAEIALELGYELAVPLPFEQNEYRKDFEGEDLVKYDELLNRANVAFEVTSLKNNDRDTGYFEAGLYVARHSHIVLALWDGEEPRIDGCATAEVIDHIMKGIDENIIVPTPIATIIHIYAPRVSTKNIKTVGQVKYIECKQDATKECLLETDIFNKDCAFENKGNFIVDEQIVNKLDDDLQYYNEIYAKADYLSSYYQKKYLNSLKVLSILGSSIVMCFLFYDELDMKILLPINALLIFISFYFVSITKNGKWHSKYISYRTLAESIRIQFFVFACGVYKNVGDLFPWSIREENDWIFKTLKVLEPVRINKSEISRNDIAKIWINDQFNYHKNASNKDGISYRRNNRFSRTLLIISITLYLIVFGIEFINPKFMNTVILVIKNNILFINSGTEFTYRGLFKILVGVISAVSIILANYYGKLSLDNKVDDHNRYCSLYDESKKIISNPTDELVWELASEELFANSAWITYSKENSPNVII